MNFTRITPEIARQLYSLAHMKPMPGAYCNEDRCGCIFGALAEAFGLNGADSLYAIERNELDPFDPSDEYDYVLGLMHGFDNQADPFSFPPFPDGSFLHRQHEAYQLGYADGVAAWNAVADIA